MYKDLIKRSISYIRLATVGNLCDYINADKIQKGAETEDKVPCQSESLPKDKIWDRFYSVNKAAMRKITELRI